MDNSEVYVRMSDHPLIQEQKNEFINADWFAYYDPEPNEKRGKLIIATVGACYYPFNRNRFKKYSSLSTVGFDEGECELVWKNKVIWLPTQGQIQKMILQHRKKPSSKTYPAMFLYHDMYKWISQDCKRQEPTTFPCDSLEKLWLAFYMHEKHNLKWDGGKWIEEKK